MNVHGSFVQLMAALLATAAPGPVSEGSVSGTIVEISGHTPVMVVITPTRLVKISLAEDAQVLRGQAGADPTPVPVSALEIGDHVTAALNESGAAVTVNATYRLIAGEVRSVHGSRVLLTSGELVEMNPSARILSPNNESITLSALKRGDKVSIKTDPNAEEGWRLVIGSQDALPPIVERPSILSITHNAETALQPGDIVHIKLTGTPGFDAVCEIAGDKCVLKETSPGLYEGIWTAASGEGISEAAVVGTLSRGKDNSRRVQAARLITVAAGISPSEDTQRAVAQRGPNGPAVTAPRVSTSVPEAPAVTPAIRPSPPIVARPAAEPFVSITRPQQGERLIDYLVVIGKSIPGAKVRVRVDYTNNLTGLLELSGTVAEEELVADAYGDFASSYLRLSHSLDSPRLHFTITAIAVDQNGFESRPAVITAVGRGL